MAVKLYYFDGRGICEPIRWVLAYGGIEFEEVRVPYNKFPPTLSESEEIKAKSRWGLVPLVEFEGKSLSQTIAILGYFAKKAGLIPQDDYEAALCDEYVFTAKDMIMSAGSTIYTSLMPFLQKGQVPDKEAAEKVREQTKRFFSIYDSIIAANDGKHLVGHSITLADILLAHMLDHVKILLGGVSLIDEKEHPHVNKLWENVVTSPKIKEWLEKRPKTKY